MRHNWELQEIGDVRCTICGTRALVPNDKECGVKAKNCNCAESAKLRNKKRKRRDPTKYKTLNRIFKALKLTNTYRQDSDGQTN